MIGRGHVSGLFCGNRMTAGQYGAVRHWCKINSVGSWPIDPDAFPKPSLPISCFLLSYGLLTRRRPASDALTRSGCYQSRILVIFFPSFHCPKPLGHLIGQCDCDDHTRSAQQHCIEPGSWGCTFLVCPTNNWYRTDNQQPPDIALPHFRGSAQHLFAAG